MTSNDLKRPQVTPNEKDKSVSTKVKTKKFNRR